jgi:hypothetical protein
MKEAMGVRIPPPTLMIPEELWQKIEFDKDTCNDCKQNECFGQAPNPLVNQTTVCVCGHDLKDHYKGGMKPCRKCGCGQYMKDED